MNKEFNKGVNSQNKGVNSQERSNNPTVANQIKDNVSSVDKLAKNISILKIDDVCSMLGKVKQKKILPNGKEIMTFDWKPEELSDVFKAIDNYKNENNLGVDNLVIIDGGMPTWLLPVISHALHPVSTAVNYPQGNKFLPLSGGKPSDNGECSELDFTVEDKGDFTLVSFEMKGETIDLDKALTTLIAPQIENGKGVVISGRGPISIATSIAESYAHTVPFVANFQPGVGAVVSISHDSEYQLGTIIEM